MTPQPARYISPKFRLLLAAAACLGPLAATCSAEFVYSQPVSNGLSTTPSDFSFNLVNQEADNFDLLTDATVLGIRAWGTYATNTPQTDDFTIRFFADDGTGNPATTPFAEFTNVSPYERFDSGLTSGINDVYQYSFDLPSGVAITAGTQYYISIVNNTSLSNYWSWSYSSTGDSEYWSRTGTSTDSNTWTGVLTNDLAFELSTTSIPEPSPLILCTVAILMGILCQRQLLSAAEPGRR